MKVNRDLLIQGGLKLLDEVGLEALTLRLLGKEAKVQAAALYWHFAGKRELLDAMATEVLARGAAAMVHPEPAADWPLWVETYGRGLRRALLGVRDGARMVAATRLTGTQYMRAVEVVCGRLVAAGFSLADMTTLLGTVYSFTLNFVQEEQEVASSRGDAERYDLTARARWLEGEGLPLLAAAGPLLFENFEARFEAGLKLIVDGARAQRWAATLRG